MNDEFCGIWVDMLIEKHECFEVTQRTQPVQLGDRTIQLSIPPHAPEFEVVEFSQTGSLLFLLLKEVEARFANERLGTVVVAVETSADHFTTRLWHETYPYLFQYLNPLK